MNEDMLQDIMNDERRHTSNVYTSKLGIGLNCFSSVLSATSSIALIVVLLRSEKRLSSVYHRRIMSIAVATLITSLAMAFSTLPMPKDMIYTAYEGIVAGNTLTCDIQYFFIALGAHSYYWFMLILALYYVCRIVLKMSEERFKKRVEVNMHIIAVVYAVGNSALLIDKHASNPSPLNPPYCSAVAYPYWCYDEAECDFIRGSKKSSDLLILIYILFTSFIIGSVVICLILTVIWVHIEKRNIASLRRDYNVSNDVDVLLNNNLLSTRDSFIQAISYLLVYCLGNAFSVLRNSIGIEKLSQGLQIVHCVIAPLDGFLNALIYVSIEVHNFRRAESSRGGQKPSLIEAFRSLWIRKNTTASVAVIMDLSIIRQDAEAIVHVTQEDGRVSESMCEIRSENLYDNEQPRIFEEQDGSASSIDDFNDEGLSYPSNNFSSENTLSQNLSVTPEITSDEIQIRSVMKQYQMQYKFKK